MNENKKKAKISKIIEFFQKFHTNFIYNIQKIVYSIFRE